MNEIVSVYLDTGVVYEIDVVDPTVGREHASEIIKTGYRHCNGDDLEWYPPHRIKKVKVTNGCVGTKYVDRTRAT